MVPHREFTPQLGGNERSGTGSEHYRRPNQQEQYVMVRVSKPKLRNV